MTVAHSARAATPQKVYRRVATYPEVSNYGDRHTVGIYEVKRVTEVHRQNGPDVWGYGGQGPHRWAADRQGRIYYLPYHGDNGSLWTREDGTHWSNRPLRTARARRGTAAPDCRHACTGRCLMARLMSVAFTEQAVRDRTKTVTRRKGWWNDKNGRWLLVKGDRLTLCRKVMGRRNGEPLIRIAEVEVIDVRRELLCVLTNDPTGQYAMEEMVREGFPGMDPREFVDRYFCQAQRMSPLDLVTRIEYRYLDDEASA